MVESQRAPLAGRKYYTLFSLRGNSADGSGSEMDASV